MTGPETRMREIANAISAFRIRLSSEDQAQADVEEALRRRDVPFEPQKILSPRDRLDAFSPLPPGGVAVEIKVKGARTAIMRQLERYAALPEVSGLVLASGVAWPFQAGEIGGKPFLAVHLGAAWL